MYATTASLSIFGKFSSSIEPWGDTFDLGALQYPWRRVYVSESIFIVKSGSVLVELRGSENTLEIGHSRITTSSFGFDRDIFNRVSSDQQTLSVISSSVSMSFDKFGVFSVSDVPVLPSVVVGGIIKSGSDFFAGI